MGVSKESISKFLIGNRFYVKLRILSPYSNRKDWGCVILREIDFLLKICWSIPCLHPSWKVHTQNVLMSSLRQSNLQLQNETPLMSYRIRAVEHRKCVAGLADAHPSLQDRILPNYTRIENAHKVCRKTCNFLLCIEVQQSLRFPFSMLRHYQMDASVLKTAVFELV